MNFKGRWDGTHTSSSYYMPLFFLCKTGKNEMSSIFSWFKNIWIHETPQYHIWWISVQCFSALYGWNICDWHLIQFQGPWKWPHCNQIEINIKNISVVVFPRTQVMCLTSITWLSRVRQEHLLYSSHNGYATMTVSTAWFEFNVPETLKDASYNVPIRNLVWEVYYTSYQVIPCAFCEQAARANLIAELEKVAARGLKGRTAFENVLVLYQNKIDFIREHSTTRGPDHQVSKAGFNLIEITSRIICFCPAFLRES